MKDNRRTGFTREKVRAVAMWALMTVPWLAMAVTRFHQTPLVVFVPVFLLMLVVSGLAGMVVKAWYWCGFFQWPTTKPENKNGKENQ